MRILNFQNFQNFRHVSRQKNFFVQNLNRHKHIFGQNCESNFVKLEIQEDILEIRAATLQNGELLYNFPIWKYSEVWEDYTLIKEINGELVAVVYRAGKVLGKYNISTGKTTDLNADF